jgi:hypothetical protein
MPPHASPQSAPVTRHRIGVIVNCFLVVLVLILVFTSRFYLFGITAPSTWHLALSNISLGHVASLFDPKDMVSEVVCNELKFTISAHYVYCNGRPVKS